MTLIKLVKVQNLAGSRLRCIHRLLLHFFDLLLVGCTANKLRLVKPVSLLLHHKHKLIVCQH
jgi:hypothetical protein